MLLHGTAWHEPLFLNREKPRRILEMQEQNGDLRDEVRYLEERLLELRQAATTKRTCQSRGTSTASLSFPEGTEMPQRPSKVCFTCSSETCSSSLAVGSLGQAKNGLKDSTVSGSSASSGSSQRGGFGSLSIPCNASSGPHGGKSSLMCPRQTVASPTSNGSAALAAHPCSPNEWQSLGSSETVQSLSGRARQVMSREENGGCYLPPFGMMQRVESLSKDHTKTAYRGRRNGQPGAKPGQWDQSWANGNATANNPDGHEMRTLTLAEIAEASFNCHDAEALVPNETLQHAELLTQQQLPTQLPSRHAHPLMSRDDVQWNIQVMCFVPWQ